MKISIKELAKSLGLSITTVSRALDGYSDVSEKTRQRVKAAAEEMGYIPNLSARHLRKQRTDTIGYILPSEGAGFNDSFNFEFFAGLSDATSRANYDLLVSTAGYGSSKENSLYSSWVHGRKVDGFVLNRIRLGDKRIRYLRGEEFPFICLEQDPEDKGPFYGVKTSSENAMARLIDHLINSGHSHIAYIGTDENLVIDQMRYGAFLAQLEIRGITPGPQLLERVPLSLESGYAAAIRLLNKSTRLSAFVCVNDMVALGAIKALEDLGLKAGRDVAVSGFDGIPESAYSNPPLTTIDQPVYEIAFNLGSMLIEKLQNPAVQGKNMIVDPTLILRKSTG